MEYAAYNRGTPSAKSKYPPPPFEWPDPCRKTRIYMTAFMTAPTLPFGKLLAAGGALIKVASVCP